jgi:hypothetical protein
MPMALALFIAGTLPTPRIPSKRLVWRSTRFHARPWGWFNAYEDQQATRGNNAHLTMR